MEAGPQGGARLSFVANLPLTQAAIDFAELHHAPQFRTADGAPFLIHPVEVAALLARERYPDHVVAAAVLHDVLEDTEVQLDELQGRFGPQVSDLVAAVTDDPSMADERERKDALRERVRRTGGDALPSTRPTRSRASASCATCSPRT